MFGLASPALLLIDPLIPDVCNWFGSCSVIGEMTAAERFRESFPFPQRPRDSVPRAAFSIRASLNFRLTTFMIAGTLCWHVLRH
jgi:hypothetical protein